MPETFTINPSDGYNHIDCDPNSTEKYTWDWSQWLLKRASIGLSSAVITMDTGLAPVGPPTVAAGKVTQVVVVSGAAGASLKMVCSITTSDTPPLHTDRTIVLDLKDL